jgi:stage II sporulation protein M
VVFEQIYQAQWLERKPWYAFLLGVFYSILGMVIALFLFPEDPSFAAITFTTLAILPSLNKLLSLEANQIASEEKITLKRLWNDHYDIFLIYLFLFLGILVVFSFFSLALPEKFIQYAYKYQVGVYYGLTGNAGNVGFSFAGIFFHNLKIVIVSLVLSLLYGAGAVFLIVWNASAWGVIFATIARDSVGQDSPIVFFILLMISVAPHMVLEALAYFAAVISGGVVSKATVREQYGSFRFKELMLDGFYIFLISLIILVLAAFVEVYVFPYINFIS